MKIKWKLRFQNKVTLTALAGAVIAFIYQFAGLLGFIPSVSEETVTNLVGLFINILVILGVVTDPTTAGVGDSAQVMLYAKPKE